MKKLIAVAALAGTVALSGCSTPGPVPTVTVTRTVTVTASPAPVPSPAQATPLALGSTATANGATVTVHALDANSAPNAPAPQSANSKWASADVEVCNTGNAAISTSSQPWRLVGNGNLRFQPSSIGYNQFPEPDYTFGEETVAPGECRRGWITFVVQQDATLTAVTYTNSPGFIARWAL
ncbi:DUF4352 domain-containing protein [Microbacterium sp. X-17]|uniref:DUF4352 domain-containing protein n=1 Tax=Microbacterium sp. X-17 TaxID=3144404 RepID=UPI0031F59C3B